MLLKAVAYWVDRYGIDFSQRGVVQTGASYTDVNAILPAKTVLAVIAVICALLFLVGAARRSSMLPAIGLGLLVLSAIMLGGVYPADHPAVRGQAERAGQGEPVPGQRRSPAPGRPTA